MRSKVKAACGAVLIGTVILSAVFWTVDGRQAIKTNQDGNAVIERNGYGEGEKTEQLQVEIQEENGKKKESELELTLQEQEYEPEKIQETLRQQGETLETLILGDNASLDEVRADLKLLTVLPESSIKVRWESSDYTVITSTGEVKSEEVSKKGAVVTLTAFLSYRDEEMLFEFPVCVYPPQLDAGERIKAEIREAAEVSEEADRTKEAVELPSQVNGKRVIWMQKTEKRAFPILLLGITITLLIAALDKQKSMEQQKERRKRLMLDYPEVVNQLTILIGAGMTVRKAWQKIVYDYAKKNDEKGNHPAYEEMSYTWHELQSQRGESECYEQFGKRCELQPYVKLGALLSQNLRKGNKGLTDMLKAETINAFEERKALAKKLGEEAGTKLLAPMFIMLAVVLVMIIVPAFFSIQM